MVESVCLTPMSASLIFSSVTGTLKGFDQLLNLVLSDSRENLRDPMDPYKVLDECRELGAIVVRGTLITTIAPVDGTEEIENPFANEEVASE